MANGLLEDLIGWAKENLENAGQSFGRSLERDRQVIDAYRGRRQVDPEQRAEMIDEYINQANPMSAVGGMIKPSTWARYAPEAKAEMTQLANRFPQAFKEKVLDTPKDIYTRIDPSLPSSTGGQFHSGYPASATVDMPAVIKLNPNQLGGGRRTLEHELIHNVNDVTGRVTSQAGNPDDAWTIARLLQSRIPAESRGSLDRVIERNTTPTSILNSRDPWKAAIDRVTNAWDSREMPQYVLPTQHKLEGMLAMDEALASLGQAAARPDATPEIRKLARDMGVSWEDKTREVLFGGKNSPKWNPRDVSLTPTEQKLWERMQSKKGDEAPYKLQGPVSEGALELFNNMKRKLGLDATFGKFRGPTERSASEVMAEMKEEMTKRTKELEEEASEGRDTGVYTMDNLVSEILDSIARQTVHMPPDLGYTGTRGGLSGMRRQLGMLQPGSTTGAGAGGAPPMPISDFKALLQHLDKYGMLRVPEGMKYGASKEGLQSSPLGRHIADAVSELYGPSMNTPAWKPEILRRLKRFIEETKE